MVEEDVAVAEEFNEDYVAAATVGLGTVGGFRADEVEVEVGPAGGSVAGCADWGEGGDCEEESCEYGCTRYCIGCSIYYANLAYVVGIRMRS